MRSLILGNTFAWLGQRSTGMRVFAKLFGSRLARFLIWRYNLLAKWLIPAGTNRQLTKPELAAYYGSFPTPDSRLPTRIFPKKILGSEAHLTEVEVSLVKLRDKPALLVWGSRWRVPQVGAIAAHAILSKSPRLPASASQALHPGKCT